MSLGSFHNEGHLPRTPLNPQEPRTNQLLLDLQGNILQDHGRKFASHSFLRFGPDSSLSRKLVRALSEVVTNALEELHRDPEKLFKSVLLSASGYEKLGLNADKIPSQQAFRLGMQDLTTPIKVKPKDKAVANPCADPPVDTWDDPFPKAAPGPDALVILGLSGDKATQILDKEEEFIKTAAVSHGAEVLGVYHAVGLKTNDGLDMEHFGFADGISNPIFLKKDYDEALDKITTAEFLPGADPLAELELVLEKDKFGSFPLSYGSYLAYRRLEQDVELFQEYGRKIKAALQEQGVVVTQEEAEARMMGRNKNGVPLVKDLSGVKPKYRTSAVNFNYDRDKDGSQCPLASHVRKVDPRGSSTTGDNDAANKIVRHGMAYGVPPSIGPKGLLFLCYQARLDAGFLTQQNRWANSETFGEVPPPKVGLDMVMGQYLPDSPPTVNQTVYTDPKVSMLIKDCVTMKGGEYFFAPSISTLKRI